MKHKLTSLATKTKTPKPKNLSPKAAYALAVKLLSEMDCTEVF